MGCRFFCSCRVGGSRENSANRYVGHLLGTQGSTFAKATADRPDRSESTSSIQEQAGVLLAREGVTPTALDRVRFGDLEERGRGMRHRSALAVDEPDGTLEGQLRDMNPDQLVAR